LADGSTVVLRCEHRVVAYSREELRIDGKDVIAHRFPCTQCAASALIWDDDVDYRYIK
jgi:hypothetical protein